MQASEWVQALKAGELEILVEVLEELGPKLLGCLGDQATDQQVEQLNKALRLLASRAQSDKLTTSEADFVWQVLAKGIGVNEVTLRAAVPVELPHSLRMQVVQRLARQEAKTNKQQRRKQLVGITLAILFCLVGLSVILVYQSGASRVGLAEITTIAGSYGMVVPAPEQKVWVLVSDQSPAQVRHIAQPGHQQPVGSTVAELQLPEGTVVSVFPDSDTLVDTGARLLRMGLSGTKWSLPKRAEQVVALENGVIIVHNLADPTGAALTNTGRVLAYDSSGKQLGEETALPVGRSVEFQASAESWLAIISNVNEVAVYDSRGVALVHPREVISAAQAIIWPDKEQLILASRTGLVETRDFSWSALWSVAASIRSSSVSYYTRLFELPDEQGWLVFCEVMTSSRMGMQDSRLVAIDHSGKTLWSYPFNTRWSSAGLAFFNPVISPDQEAIMFSLAHNEHNILQINHTLSGRVLGRIPSVSQLRGAGVSLDATGKAYALVALQDQAKVYGSR